MKKHLVQAFALASALTCGLTLTAQTTFDVQYADDISFECKLLDDGTLSIEDADLIGVVDLYIPDELEHEGTTYSVSTINSMAFWGKGMTTVTLADGISEIDILAFCDCENLTTVTLGTGITSIGSNAFCSEGITTVTWNCRNATYTEEQYYGDCLFGYDGAPNLTTLNIGSEVETLPSEAFDKLYMLSTVNIAAERLLTVTNQYFWNSLTSNAVINVPCGWQTAYSASQWGQWGTVSEDCTDVDPSTFNLTVESSDITLGSVRGSEQNIEAGQTREVMALAQGGIRFNGWSDGSMENPRTVIINSDTTLTALFAAELLPDTVRIHDTIRITDTIHVHDTIYVEHQGIDPTDAAATVRLYQQDGTLCIDGAEGEVVNIYDLQGRLLQSAHATAHTTLPLPATGTYVVRIGQRTSRKIVITR